MVINVLNVPYILSFTALLQILPISVYLEVLYNQKLTGCIYFPDLMAQSKIC